MLAKPLVEKITAKNTKCVAKNAKLYFLYSSLHTLRFFLCALCGKINRKEHKVFRKECKIEVNLNLINLSNLKFFY